MELLIFLAIVYIATLIAFVITLLCLIPRKDDRYLTEKEYYHSLHTMLEKCYKK